MTVERIDLYKYFGVKRGIATGGYITAYLHAETSELERKVRPAMIVLPGGGYGMLSEREGEPIAIKYLVNGYQAFVLEYSLHTAYPVPLIEACLAVAYVRDNADKFRIDDAKVCAVGFSAGGHLTGMLATVGDGDTAVFDVIGGLKRRFTPDGVRPNAVVLSYPVVTMFEATHGGSRDVITGGDESLREKLSVDLRVTDKACPAFIWHTFEDDCVDVKNALMLATAYKKAGVPFGLHIFEKGWHGLSLCNAETHNQTEKDIALAHVGKWAELSLDFLNARGFVVKVAERK